MQYTRWNVIRKGNFDANTHSKRETFRLKRNTANLTIDIHFLSLRIQPRTLQWRHNDHDGVSNHQPHGCLLNRLFGRRSKKTSKLHVTGLGAGNSPGPVNSPHKWPVTRKIFPFDDVIMESAWPLLDKGLITADSWLNVKDTSPRFQELRIYWTMPHLSWVVIDVEFVLIANN